MTQSRDISNFWELDAKLQMVVHHPAKFEIGRCNGSLKQANQKNGRRKKKKKERIKTAEQCRSGPWWTIEHELNISLIYVLAKLHTHGALSVQFTQFALVLCKLDMHIIDEVTWPTFVAMYL